MVEQQAEITLVEKQMRCAYRLRRRSFTFVSMLAVLDKFGFGTRADAHAQLQE